MNCAPSDTQKTQKLELFYTVMDSESDNRKSKMFRILETFPEFPNRDLKEKITKLLKIESKFNCCSGYIYSCNLKHYIVFVTLFRYTASLLFVLRLDSLEKNFPLLERVLMVKKG